MKKNTIIAALIASALVACALFLQDGLIYAFTAFIAMSVLGITRIRRKSLLKLTRWAKAHPYKAQSLIAGTEIALMGLGLVGGYNLKELGFVFSDSTAYVFSILMTLGFLSVHFLPKYDQFTIPREVERQKLKYLGISLASLMMMAFVGNRIGDTHPGSVLAHTLESIDQSIMSTIAPDTEHEEALTSLDRGAEYPLALASLNLPARESMDPSKRVADKTALQKAEKAEKKMKREEKKLERKAGKNFRKQLRLAVLAGSCGLAIFLIVLLVAPLCAGICLFAFGVAGEAGIAAIILGPVIAGLSIWGMVALAKWCGKDKK